ncbi:hypothetical protein A374_04039 [Fictibacillus macauensis ZFHKF-1]|uniref:Probable membrane transporter protein n=1 Tax=Fictibacillus macauensis ZFHKF-1 TaxID=1196324 RepID=I8ALE0_9BACL|nr:sulfite exporter TauE/SafE family protein [Fictibacillus macauensis]EIT86712.1 hypothetical protein A374_04039 [Fictibacillus macauensis ZFHKF-1]
MVILLTLFILGFMGSFLSGMVGIGGSVISYPMLLYIPPLLGVGALTAHEVTGAGAVQVLFATFGGMLAYRKSGYLHKSLIGYMGSSIVVGSLLGSYSSNQFSEQTLTLVYGILALIAVMLMFTPKREALESGKVTFHRGGAIFFSFVIGLVAGVLGAGGAFILVPVMLAVLKIPTKTTIATSLAITFLSSIGSTIGKLVTHQVPYIPAIVLMIVSLIASPIGAKVGQRLQAKWLQRMLATFIIITAIKIWWSLV